MHLALGSFEIDIDTILSLGSKASGKPIASSDLFELDVGRRGRYTGRVGGRGWSTALQREWLSDAPRNDNCEDRKCQQGGKRDP